MFSLSNIDLIAGGKTILSSITLNIPRGSFLSVLGPSGSGKTSLLRILNGLETPDTGSIQFQDKDLDEYDPIELRKKVGLVFQTPIMVPGTVKENLELPFRWNKKDAFPNEKELLKILDQIGLPASMLNQDARDLSGGEKQRISLGRTLLNSPEVLLLDEPTASLDPGLASRIIKLISELHSSLDLTTILVSHQHHLARRVASDCVFLIENKIAEAGSIELLDNPKTDAAKNFLKEEMS